MRSDITKEFNVIKIHQPVCIIYHHSFAVRKIDETFHLLFEAVTVVLNGFRCHHLTHIASSGRITNHSSSAADQCDWLVSCHLQTFHQTQCHEMSYMKAVCCGVKSNIKCCFSIVDQFFNFFFICYLGNQAAGNQFIVNCHRCSPFLFCIPRRGLYYRKVIRTFL